MPKLSADRLPKYCHHKSSDQACVYLSGQQILLGPYGSAASRQKYNRLLAEWLASDRQFAPVDHRLTIIELIDRFWIYAKSYYRNPDGAVANEVEMYRYALRPLKRLYGNTAVEDFGPLALKAVREAMIAPQKVEVEDKGTGESRVVQRQGWSRNHVNRQIGRIKAVFRWGVAEQLVPPTVYEALKCVDGLRRGRCDARETEKVGPVPEEIVRATLPYLSRPLAAVAKLQLLTGARGGELLSMRGCDIDATRPVWLYHPALHKNTHKGLKREIRFGPQGQEIIKPFLKPNPQAYLFCPADALAELRERRRANRKTSKRYGNGPGDNVKAKPKRKPGERYESRAYAHAIRRACEKANLPHWHPHQIRHTFGTNIRASYGFEAANVLLGHESDEATGIYAEKDASVADKIMAEVG